MSTLFQFGGVGWLEKQTLGHRALLSLALSPDLAREALTLPSHWAPLAVSFLQGKESLGLRGHVPSEHTHLL